MIEPISASALIGVGWAGRKILGPSLSEIGDQLKGYVSGRLTKIFNRVDEKDVDPKLLKPLPNAFALRFFQSASMSEDDELLTDLWANLLINSAVNFDSRKLLYLDILDKISPIDAHILSDLIPADEEYRLGLSLKLELDYMRSFFIDRVKALLKSHGGGSLDQELADQFNNEISAREYSWPVRILDSDIPFVIQPMEGVIVPSESSVGLANGMGVYDPLIRQRLLQPFDIDFLVGKPMRVGGIMATDLGIEFLRSCRGVSK